MNNDEKNAACYMHWVTQVLRQEHIWSSCPCCVLAFLSSINEETSVGQLATIGDTSNFESLFECFKVGIACKIVHMHMHINKYIYHNMYIYIIYIYTCIIYIIYIYMYYIHM